MTKILQRHDTAANWTSVNPVLAAGEMGIETDTNKFKFGDGVTAWSSLAYAAGEGGGTQLTSADGETSYSTLALGDNLVVNTGDISWTNPKMTSNSQDGYIASASNTQTTNYPYRAFDKDTTGQDLCWFSGSVSMPQWIMLECPEPVRLTSCMIMNEVKTPESFKSGYIQGSNDRNTFDTLYTITNRAATAGLQTTYQINTDKYYKYLRVYCTATSGSGLSIQEIEFKGFVKDPSAVPSLNVNLDEKQDKLTAGANITIEGNVISATGGVTSSGNNTFTGTNRFNKKMIIPLNTSDHDNGIEMTSSLFLGNPDSDYLNPVWIARKTQKGSQLGRFTLAANGRVGIELQDGATQSSATSRALFQLDDTGIYYRQGAGETINIWELINTMSSTIESLTARVTALENKTS